MITEFLVNALGDVWGPIRLLTSILVLASLGSLLSTAASLFLLPRLWHLATTDKGRAHAFNAEASVGKPMGVGIFMILFTLVATILFVPFDLKVYLCMLVLFAASLVGFGDDVKEGGYSELTLGVSDLFLALAASLIILYGEDQNMWLPFTDMVFEVPYWLAVAIYTPVVWLSINALNCNDGVDGLSGSLSAVTITVLGFIMYSAVGNVENAEYLLLPFKPEAAYWVIVSAVLVGSILGYLWYNAPPSVALMGDAGSRPIGLFIGMCIVVVGNPTLIFFVAGLILVNGATGLVKVALIRIFRIRLLSSVRFPLHDHSRKNLNWSNSQVLIRYLLIHIGTLWFLMLLLLKVR